MPTRQLQEFEVSLARLASTGDEQAFSKLAESLRGRLSRYSMMVCHQREDAEEVVQETLLQAFQKIGDLREPESVHAWLFRMAVNNCRMKRRRGVHDPKALESLESYGEHAAVSDDHLSPEDALLADESNEALREAILCLPEMYRIVVLLRCLEGLSTGETAHALETSEDVVRTRLHRARVAIARHRLADPR